MTKIESDVPNPGSDEAIAMGCSCPVLDNGHGRGYMGGIKDENGEIIFVYTVGCKLHGPPHDAALREGERG